MEGIQKIKNQITSEAKKEANAIISEAKKEVSKIKSEESAKVNVEKKKILEQGGKEAGMEQNRIISSARLKVQKIDLEKREALIQLAFENARNKVADMRTKSKEKYESALLNLAKEGIEEIDAKNLELCFSKQDSNLGKKIASKLKTGFRGDLEISGGVVIKSKDGRFQIDNSIEERIKRMEPELRKDASGILFGGNK